MYTDCQSFAMFNVLKAFIASSQNDCNRAKSPGIGRLQIRLVYFAPNTEIFYPIKTVYPTRRWFCTAGFCAAEKFLVLRDKRNTVAKKYMIYNKVPATHAFPFEGKVA